MEKGVHSEFDRRTTGALGLDGAGVRAYESVREDGKDSDEAAADMFPEAL